MESRKHNLKPSSRLSRSADLPLAFRKGVRDVFNVNFVDGLKELSKLQKVKNSFEVRGGIFTDEIVLAVSLVTEKQLAATTVHCSVDFDPKASTPTAQDLLNVCVDAIGSVYATLLDLSKPERLEQLAADTLSSLDDIPFEWTKVDFDSRRVWLLVDKSNPTLDELADRWLAENDPKLREAEDEHEEETEDLFFTGPKGSKRGGGDSVH